MFIVVLVDNNSDRQMVMILKLPPPCFLKETVQDSGTLISKSCSHCRQGIKSLGTHTAWASHSAHRRYQPTRSLPSQSSYSAFLSTPQFSTKLQIISNILIFTPQLNYHMLLEGRTFSRFPHGWYRPVHSLPPDPLHPPASLFSAPGLSGALGH